MGDRNLYQGTLDLLILRAVAQQSLHGWGISQWLAENSGGHFDVPQGSLYPALHRLERQGLLSARWRKTAEGRRAKFYTISRKGEKALSATQSRWEEYARAVEKIIAAGT